MWFDIQLDEATTLSNRPGMTRLVYGRPFLPVLAPFDVRRGEIVELELRAHLVRSNYIWSWTGGVVNDSARRFQQSSFDGGDVSPTDFANFRLDATPRRSEHADWVAFVLGAMDGATTLSDVASRLRTTHPEFDEQEALDFVSDVVADYGSTV